MTQIKALITYPAPWSSSQVDMVIMMQIKSKLLKVRQGLGVLRLPELSIGAWKASKRLASQSRCGLEPWEYQTL